MRPLLKLLGTPVALLVFSAIAFYWSDRDLQAFAPHPLTPAAFCAGPAFGCDSGLRCFLWHGNATAVKVTAFLTLLLLTFAGCFYATAKLVRIGLLQLRSALRGTWILAVTGYYLSTSADVIVFYWLSYVLLFGWTAIWAENSQRWLPVVTCHWGRVFTLLGALMACAFVISLEYSRVTSKPPLASVPTSIVVAGGPQETPLLWKAVQGWAEGSSFQPPRHILIGLEPFTGCWLNPVRCGEQIYEGGTLYVSLTLARLMTETEFAAHVIQSMSASHFSAPLSQICLPEYKHFSKLLQAEAVTSSSQPAGLLWIWGHAWYPIFEIAQRNWQTRVLQRGLISTGAQSTILSLLKKQRYFEQWPLFLRRVRTDLRSGSVTREDGTHVTAREYYAAIGERFAESEAVRLRDEIREPVPSDPALSFFPGAEDLELRLSRMLRNALVFEA